MKKTKRLMAGLVTVAMITAIFPLNVFAASSKPDGSGTVDDPYLISTARQLIYFNNIANNASDKTAINAKLTADIVLNEGVMDASSTATEWTPLTDYASTFDGNGHTISGMFVKNNNINYDGFIASAKKAEIKNLSIINSYIGGEEYIGGIAAYLEECTVESCSYNGILDVNTNTTDTTIYIGSIAGKTNTIDIYDCHNKCEINVKNYSLVYLGGIIGYSTAIIRTTNTNIKNSSNTGDLSIQNGYVGGIVGNIDENYDIENCFNSGKIYGGVKAGYVGGLFGHAYKGVDRNSYISNCFNTGDVKALSDNGRAWGIRGDIISLSYNTGAVSGYQAYGIYGNPVTQSYNTGTIKTNTSAKTAYGIYGGKDYCYNYDSGSEYYNQKVGKYYQLGVHPQLAFTCGKIAYELGWYQNIDLGEPDETPVLDDTHYKVYYTAATNTYSNKKSISSGFCGDDIFYTFDISTGTLELEGEGNITDSPWYSDANYIYEIVISGDINVSKSMFESYPYLKTVYIDRGSVADDISLYPSGISVKYSDDGSDISTPVQEPDKTVTVHYDSVYKKKYSDGIYSDGYKSGKNNIYSALTEDDKECGISSGETLSIVICDTKGEEKTSFSLSYAEIASENVTDVWISNDLFYTSKPDNWGEDITLSILGDVDGDRELTILDATHILKKVSNPEYILPGAVQETNK